MDKVNDFLNVVNQELSKVAGKKGNDRHSTDYADQAMMHLSDASKYGVLLADSRFWPDTDSFSAKFFELRKILEVGLESEKASNSEHYQTYIPNLNDMELLPSPKIILGKIAVSDLNEEGDERALLTKSKINLNWIPYYDLKTLNVNSYFSN